MALLLCLHFGLQLLGLLLDIAAVVNQLVLSTHLAEVLHMGWRNCVFDELALVGRHGIP